MTCMIISNIIYINSNNYCYNKIYKHEYHIRYSCLYMNVKIDEKGYICYICNKRHISLKVGVGTGDYEKKLREGEDVTTTYWECDNCKTQFFRNREGDFNRKQIY